MANMFTALELIDQAVAKDERAWKKSPDYYPARRFAHHKVGPMMAKKIAHAMDISVPKLGYEVTVATRKDMYGEPRVVWHLMNKSGRFYLRADYYTE
jgi:hypothetical protein